MKKNVLLRPLNILGIRTGPPIAPPNTLSWNAALLAPNLFDSQSLAFNFSLRKYSYAEPRKLLVPDLVTSTTAPPESRPYSAERPLVSTLNSDTASMDGTEFGTLCR